MLVDLSTVSPKQELFMLAKTRFVAYGGAMGGGKSWAVRKKAVLLALKYGGIRILILRRSYPELRANHINVLQAELFNIAEYTDSKKCFSFPNGSVINCGYCDCDRDALRYQGQEYDIIFIDEATQFLEHWFVMLTTRLRGTNKFPKRFYLTCNPGGVGHEWVKRLFISKEYKDTENPADYTFIAATFRDNTALSKNDPAYINTLDNLDPVLRAAWRDGNWDMMAGQYFCEFKRDKQVMAPIPILPHWKIYRAIDYGLDCFACLWIAVDEMGRYYVFKEFAEGTQVVNSRFPDGLVISEGAKEINRAFDGKVMMTLAPPDLWARTHESGRGEADLFFEHGLPLVKSSNRRAAGWLHIKELFAQERLFIFDNCVKLISNITALQRDPSDPNDCLTEPHSITHLPDALRYFCSYWITIPVVRENKTPLQRFKEKSVKTRK